MSSLRYFTGDGLPPQIQSFVTSQDVDNETTALHIADGSIHRVMDDFVVSYDTLWSSRKTADEIAAYTPPPAFDQDLNTFDTPTFLTLALQSDYNASLLFRRGGGGPKWVIQNSASDGDRLVWRDVGGQVAMTLLQSGELVLGNTGLGVAYSLPSVKGVDGQSLVLQGDALQWTSPAGPKKHLSATFSDPTLATLITPVIANEWTAVVLPLQPQVSLGFGVTQSGEILSGVSGKFDISINISLGLIGNQPEEICEVAFFAGMIYPQSLISFVCDDSDKTFPLVISTRFIANINAGESLQVFLRNSLDNPVPRPLSIANLNVTLVEI